MELTVNVTIPDGMYCFDCQFLNVNMWSIDHYQCILFSDSVSRHKCTYVNKANKCDKCLKCMTDKVILGDE